MKTPMEWEPGSRAAGIGTAESVWSSRIQWGAILAGSAAGFGVVIIMAMLGAALGMTAGTIGAHATDSATTDTAGKAAVAFGIGSAIWMLLTAAATGLVGGWVLNSTSRRDRPYSSFIFGLITWAVANCAALMVAAPSLGGAISGAGAGVGGAAAGVSNRPDVVRMDRDDRSRAGDRSNAPAPLTETEKAAAADAAKKAATAATVAAWVALISQLVALSATVFMAGMHRHAGMKVITELRARPVPAP